jgi:hypothetical protein
VVVGVVIQTTEIAALMAAVEPQVVTQAQPLVELDRLVLYPAQVILAVPVALSAVTIPQAVEEALVALVARVQVPRRPVLAVLA